MLKIIRILKRIYIYIRETLKVISLMTVGTILIGLAIIILYNPIYKVTFNGEDIGYCKDKETLQNKINHYMEYGNEDSVNIAFVQIDDMPEYQMCLQKKGIDTNDNEIFDIIKSSGVTYYRFYAILDEGIEKTYLTSFEDAENTIAELKEKESQNIADLTIVEKYEIQLPELITKTDAVAQLYEKKVVQVVTKKNTSIGSNYKYVDIGLSLIKPTTGILTSRYGTRWGRSHTGIDIGASTGTDIYASASGTITFSGWNGAYGNLIIITHNNGVQTYYGHCSKLLVSQGQTVQTGQLIGKVGSTGRSTGPHLHFEIRVNGSPINPQSYIGY